MEQNGLTYNYEELINKSEEINLFAVNLDKHLITLSNLNKKISNNFFNEQANTIYKSLEYLNNKSAEIQESLIAFSRAIHDDIAPTYKEIESKAQEKVDSYYE